jgi:putative acetyltransferase
MNPLDARHSVWVRPYSPADLDAVITIFVSAVREIASRDYNPAQLNAWAQVDRDAWALRALSRLTWVAMIDNLPAGFTDLEPDGHLDVMYVHPRYQRMGVGTALLDSVENATRMQGLSRLFTEASITAKPFFAKRGFRVITPQVVTCRGETLTNFRMQKTLEVPRSPRLLVKILTRQNSSVTTTT